MLYSHVTGKEAMVLHDDGRRKAHRDIMGTLEYTGVHREVEGGYVRNR